MTDTTAARPFLTPKRAEMLRDYVPFIAIALVILMFWAISGERFMSVRNWTFIAQQTPVLTLLAFAQLMVVTTGSIDISIGSNLAFSAFLGALGMLWFGDAGLVLGVVAGGLVGVINGIYLAKGITYLLGHKQWRMGLILQQFHLRTVQNAGQGVSGQGGLAP